MQLFLSPVDVWLFRDGRPFDANSDHRANSLFPPYPSVMQGVIRSHQLVVKGVALHDPDEIKRQVGTVDDYGNLRLCGPFLARWENEQLTRYFPVPTDVWVNEKTKQFEQLKLSELDPKIVTSIPQVPMKNGQPAPLKLLVTAHESKPTKDSPGEWLNQDQLVKCLQGNAVSATKTSDLFVRETRFGIKRNDATRTTEEGALYEAEFIRPCKNVGLYVEVEGYSGWAERGVMRIGGEGRGAAYEKITAPALPSLKIELPAQFKVYFATPTYFKNGWLPESWSKFFDGEVKLVAAAVNRYESIGGFDWTKKGADAQKPARRCVPAGSVYYFESNGTAKLKNNVLEMNAIADEGAQIGFGQIFIQEVNHV